MKNSSKIYLTVSVVVVGILSVFVILIYKNKHLPVTQISKDQFFVESIGATEQDTKELEVHELSAFPHQGGNSYQLIILVNRESGFLPERLYLIGRETKQLFANSPVSLSRFQSGCRKTFDPGAVAKYETEFFKISQKLPFPEEEPALKNNFLAVVVYQDSDGKRYFAQKEIAEICQVMME